LGVLVDEYCGGSYDVRVLVVYMAVERTRSILKRIGGAIVMCGKFAAWERRLLYRLENLRKRRNQLRNMLLENQLKMKLEYDKLPDGVRKKLSYCMRP